MGKKLYQPFFIHSFASFAFHQISTEFQKPLSSKSIRNESNINSFSNRTAKQKNYSIRNQNSNQKSRKIVKKLSKISKIYTIIINSSLIQNVLRCHQIRTIRSRSIQHFRPW